jgi:hypothetical protein
MGRIAEAGAGLVTGLCVIVEGGKAAGGPTDAEVGTTLPRVADDYRADIAEGIDVTALDRSAVKASAPGG